MLMVPEHVEKSIPGFEVPGVGHFLSPLAADLFAEVQSCIRFLESGVFLPHGPYLPISIDIAHCFDHVFILLYGLE